MYRVNRERVDDKIEDLENQVDKLEVRLTTKSNCTQGPLFTIIQSQIQENSKANKKMQTWQAGVGISLLVFFLTVGVAALRYVDQLNYSSQTNKDNIASLKEDIAVGDKKTSESMKELKNLLEKLILDKNKRPL
ncbi:MAG: hypothetical protein MUO60_17805 [Clostridiaceae bacterium]|nr:hypothetical protein [Clostridiaceae bacterium]